MLRWNLERLAEVCPAASDTFDEKRHCGALEKKASTLKPEIKFCWLRMCYRQFREYSTLLRRSTHTTYTRFANRLERYLPICPHHLPDGQ